MILYTDILAVGERAPDEMCLKDVGRTQKQPSTSAVKEGKPGGEFADELKRRISSRRSNVSTTIASNHDKVDKLGNKSDLKVTQLCNEVNRFQKSSSTGMENPNGHKTWFERQNNQTNLGVRAAATAFNRLPAGSSNRLRPSAYNAFNPNYQQRSSYVNVDQQLNESRLGTEIHNVSLPLSHREPRPIKEQRPATTNLGVNPFDDFKLPPIRRDTGRGPSQRTSKPGYSRLTEVSKMVEIFERADYRKRDQIDHTRLECTSENDGALAKRFAQNELDSLAIHPGDDATTRQGKIRRMVQMFDKSAPVYNRTTPIGEMAVNMEPRQECSREYVLSNSNADLYRSYNQGKQSSCNILQTPLQSSYMAMEPSRKPTRSCSYQAGYEPFTVLADTGHHDHDGRTNPSPINLPSFMTNGRKPAWMLGDKTEVRLDVQNKWDNVNRELRDKMKCARSDHALHHQVEDVEMVSDDHDSSSGDDYEMY